MYKKILLAIDGSENSDRATKKAIQLEKIFNAEVIAFHAVEYHKIPKIMPLPMPYNTSYSYAIAAHDQELIRKQMLESGETLIKKTTEDFNDAGVEVDARLVEFNSPEDYALKQVEEENIDLIILGCKGHSKLKRVFLGSVAEKLVNEASCDVLVVR